MTTTQTTDKQWQMIEREITSLLKQLKKQIGDEYRASEDDTVPGMQVTVSTNDGSDWSYQTGDNSYTGGCYGHAHWAVINLYRRSKSAELAAEAVSELADLVATAQP